MQGIEKDPLVSVLCLVYNHEEYLRDCLDGIIAQQAMFPIEIIIHDDASTDDSVSIAREYAEKHPDAVTLLIEEENQYSKGKPIINDIMLPCARGRYIAFCEGDDYWIDPGKLQKQIDFLESHEEYSACVHNTIRKDARDGKTESMYAHAGDYDVPFPDVLRGGGSCWHTSSLVFRKECSEGDQPLFLGHSAIVGDHPWALFLSVKGKIRFLDRDMSVYRYMSNGSWSERILHSDDEYIASRHEIITMLELFDEYTQGGYHQAIAERLLRLRYSIDEALMNYSLLAKGDFRPIYLTKGRSYRIKTQLKRFLKPLYKVYRAQVASKG